MESRSFNELRESGLLWLINRVVLHPRGYALAFVYADSDVTKEPVGWKLVGDGAEPWSFSSDSEDELFLKIKALLP